MDQKCVDGGPARRAERRRQDAGRLLDADVAQDLHRPIEKAVADVKEALKGEDIEKIKSTKDELLKASHKLAEQMYKAASEKQQASGAPTGDAAGPQGPATNGNGNHKATDDAVDAEIVDEGKK